MASNYAFHRTRKSGAPVKAAFLGALTRRGTPRMGASPHPVAFGAARLRTTGWSCVLP